MNTRTFIVLLVLAFIFICFVITSSLISILILANRPTNSSISLINRHSGTIKFSSLIDNSNFDASTQPIGQNFSQCSKKSLLPRILNGQNATPDIYPWIVSLRLFKNQNLYDHFCAGVLLSEKIVISAAHCLINKKPSEILAVFGLYRRTDLSDEIMKNSYQISKIITHEDNTINDIAILVMSKPVIFKKNVSPICISNEYLIEEFFGKQVNVIGWGLRISNQPSEILQQTQLTLLNNSDSRCANHIKDTNKNTLICALQITKNKNSTDYTNLSTICSGDSGGPLFIFHDGKWLLLGIVSFVQTYMSADNQGYFCHPKLASFYSNVVYYYTWIKKFISLNSNYLTIKNIYS